MPISAENRRRYPDDWVTIAFRIKHKRAKRRCEGSPAYPDCRAAEGEPHPVTGSKVVLTIGHLNHKPEDCRDENLKCWCQRCHNKYDQPHRQANAAKIRRAKKAAGDLFE